MIPVRRQEDGFRMRGRHRRQMREEFESGEMLEIYGQRSKTETIFSVIKRMFGSSVSAHNHSMGEKELMYRILAYNCHRTCMISFIFWMISRKPL